MLQLLWRQRVCIMWPTTKCSCGGSSRMDYQCAPIHWQMLEQKNSSLHSISRFRRQRWMPYLSPTVTTSVTWLVSAEIPVQTWCIRSPALQTTARRVGGPVGATRHVESELVPNLETSNPCCESLETKQSLWGMTCSWLDDVAISLSTINCNSSSSSELCHKALTMISLIRSEDNGHVLVCVLVHVWCIENRTFENRALVFTTMVTIFPILQSMHANQMHLQIKYKWSERIKS